MPPITNEFAPRIALTAPQREARSLMVWVQKMDDLLVKIPMVLLTWLSAVWVWATFELNSDLAGKLIVMAGAFFTLIAALLKWLRDRRTEKQLQHDEKRISELEAMNLQLIQQALRFEEERAEFREEIRRVVYHGTERE